MKAEQASTVFHLFLLISCLFSYGSGQLLVAQAPSTKSSTGSASNTYPQAQLKSDLLSTDESRIQSALSQIKAAAAKRGRGFAGPGALEVLFEVKRFEDVDRIALEQILAEPGDATYVGNFAKTRAKALMQMGKKAEALAAAKGYYNVAPMAQTQDAINLLALVLENSGSGEPGIGQRFLKQQIAWASSDPTTQPATNADLGDPILPTIKVDPKPYAEAIDAIFPAKANEALKKGNLLLLADRSPEAHACFELALNTARGSSISWLIESIARSIRAEKGCVAPANVYIVSMQKKQE